MISNMTEWVNVASCEERIVPGFNVYGYEDALAVIQAAENFNAPVILMSNGDAISHMKPQHSAALFRSLAEGTDIPVIIHLDHAKTFELVFESIEAGYTSVMYDGSSLSLEENISNTCRVLDVARQADVSVEAELGSVPYADRNEEIKSVYTVPEEVGNFISRAPVDALAVAVGSQQRMRCKSARLDFERLASIEKYSDTPLVIHGTSGIIDKDVRKLLSTKVGKMNIGTALRMAFGNKLKEEVRLSPEEFDRVKLLKQPMAAVRLAAEEKYRLLGWKEKTKE